MKKIFILLLSILFITPVMAEEFSIDVDKIDISYKSNSLIRKLDSSYKIDLEGFEKDKNDDKKAKEYTKKVIKILFSEDNELRRRDFLNEGYIVSNDGFGVLTSSFNLQAFYEDITKLYITYDYLKYINVTKYSDGIVTTTYIPNAKVFGGTSDVILTLILREVDGDFKVFAASYVTGKDLLENYNKIVDSESKGNFITETSKKISVMGGEVNPDYVKMTDLYNNRISQVVSVSGIKDGATNTYGSGFFIRKGVVVTTWSLFLSILNNNEFVYVNDAYGNAYKVEGVVAADTKYDVVLLKIDTETGNEVSFAQADSLKPDDSVYMISSKNNIGYSINYGSFISNTKGVLKSQLTVTQSDVGSALYNGLGFVVGFNTGNILNSSVSSANSTEYLIAVQSKLRDTNYKDIQVTSVQDFQDKYYYNYGLEETLDNVSDKVWKEYSKIGDIENTIKLDVLKKSYKDKILSIRYKNTIYGSLDTWLMTMEFENKLDKDGYKMVYYNNTKRIYENKKYRVVIKEDLDYLIILMMEK